MKRRKTTKTAENFSDGTNKYVNQWKTQLGLINHLINPFPSLAFTKALAITESVPWKDAVNIGTTSETKLMKWPAETERWGGHGVTNHSLAVSCLAWSVLTVYALHGLTMADLFWSGQHHATFKTATLRLATNEQSGLEQAALDNRARNRKGEHNKNRSKAAKTGKMMPQALCGHNPQLLPKPMGSAKANQSPILYTISKVISRDRTPTCVCAGVKICNEFYWASLM